VLPFVILRTEYSIEGCLEAEAKNAKIDSSSVAYPGLHLWGDRENRVTPERGIGAK